MIMLNMNLEATIEQKVKNWGLVHTVCWWEEKVLILKMGALARVSNNNYSRYVYRHIVSVY